MHFFIYLRKIRVKFMKIKNKNDGFSETLLFAMDLEEEDVNRYNIISEISPNNHVQVLVGDDQKGHNDSLNQSDEKNKCWEICTYLLDLSLCGLCFLFVGLYVVSFFSNVRELICKFFSKNHSESEIFVEAIKYVFGTFSLISLLALVLWIVFIGKNDRKVSHFVYFTICNGLFYFGCFWLQYSKTFDFCSYFK